MPVWRVSLWRMRGWHVLVWRNASLAHATLARFSFLHLCWSSMQFSLCEGVLSASVWRILLFARRGLSIFAHFSFLHSIVCVISLLIISTCHRGYIGFIKRNVKIVKYHHLALRRSYTIALFTHMSMTLLLYGPLIR